MKVRSRPKGAAPADEQAGQSKVSVSSGTDEPGELQGVPPPVWLDSLELATEVEQIVPATMLVAYAIARYADWKTGRDVFPAQSTLARKTRLSVRSVKRHLAVLRDAGFLHRVSAATGRHGVTDVYRLTVPLWITELGVPK